MNEEGIRIGTDHPGPRLWDEDAEFEELLAQVDLRPLVQREQEEREKERKPQSPVRLQAIAIAICTVWFIQHLVSLERKPQDENPACAPPGRKVPLLGLQPEKPADRVLEEVVEQQERMRKFELLGR